MMSDRNTVVSQLVNHTSHVLHFDNSPKIGGKRKNMKFENDQNMKIWDEIADPFQELHEPVNVGVDALKKQTVREKWDLAMAAGFSTKYTATFEKMKLKQKELFVSTTHDVDAKSKPIIKGVSMVDEETRKCIADFIKNECQFTITMPEEIFQNTEVFKKGQNKFCIKDPYATD